ncbi:MAG: alanine dehydrogenase [Dehalococcoidia bacterium]
MNVGTIRETKVEECRVGLTPLGVSALREAGHTVLVERGAGQGSGFSDDQYAQAGATLLDTAQEVAARCDLLVKVKELTPAEYTLLRPGLILFTYLHLAALPELAERVLASGATAIAYETVQLPDGSLPLLAPMSQVAGRMAAEIGVHLLKRPGPGRGKLIGGVAGVAPGRAAILGSGSVATAACRVLIGLEARTTVMSRDLRRLAYLEEHFGGRIATRVATSSTLAEELAGADLLIAAILVPGAATPKVVTRKMVRSMGPGAVIVDVCIDQGGAVETSRPTTHAKPTFVEEGVIHYCVPNMPGAVPQTSTEALTSATLPYVLTLADHGLDAIRQDTALAMGVNAFQGKLTCRGVAEALGLPYTPLEEVL